MGKNVLDEVNSIIFPVIIAFYVSVFSHIKNSIRFQAPQQTSLLEARGEAGKETFSNFVSVIVL